MAVDLLAIAHRLTAVLGVADSMVWENDLTGDHREQAIHLVEIAKETAEKLQETLDELQNAHYYESGLRSGLEDRLKEANAKLTLGLTDDAPRALRATANKIVRRRKAGAKGGAR